MATPVRILLVSGSLRAGSTNAAVLRTAGTRALDGIETVAYHGMATLPHFNPDDDFDPLPPAVVELRAAIASADAVLFCTPEYAGALPGSFKNLLDWTVGGGEVYGKPVAWINIAGVHAPTRGTSAHASLRTVLGYVGAEVVEPATGAIPVPRQAVEEDGLIRDREIVAAIERALVALSAHVRR
ncbi:MAG: NAD(P)H-dependent oxidoreductase [Gaiellales bacterium]